MKMNMKLLLGAIGLALAGFFGYHRIYWPQQDQAHRIQGEIAQLNAHHQRQAEVAALLRQVERYRTSLAPEADVSWLTREVMALSTRSGVELTTITQEAPQFVAPFTRLAVTVRFNATYHTLGVLLEQIEQADHFIQVERLEVTPASTRGDPAAMWLVLSTLYVSPLRESAGVIAN